MSTRQDDPQFRDLCNWYAGDAHPDDVRQPKDIRWLVYYIIGLCFIAMMLMVAGRAQAQTCEWNADCISWKPPTAYTDNSPLDATQIASYKLETATAASGPWTLLATIAAPATSYKRQPVSGTNYYRVSVTMKSGVTGSSLISSPTTTVEPAPGPVQELLIVENIGYQINLGTNNKVSLSRVASVPLGRECVESAKFADEFRTVHVIKNRDWAVMDPDPKKPGQFFARPRQVWAKCERKA